MKKEFMMPEVKVMALNMRENIAKSDNDGCTSMPQSFKKGEEEVYVKDNLIHNQTAYPYDPTKTLSNGDFNKLSAVGCIV